MAACWTASAAVGGKAWLIHFSLPPLLMLTVIPWPLRIETVIASSLRSGITETVAHCLVFCGVAARASGNTLEMASGSLGIEEACSGMRSLVLATLASIFLGEFFRLRISRRLALLLVAVLCAMALNFIRNCVLALIFRSGGDAALDAWHDPAGHAANAILVATLWWIAARNNREQRGSVDSGFLDPKTIHPHLAYACAALFLMAHPLVESAYRIAESGKPTAMSVPKIHSPSGSISAPFSPRLRAQLRFSDGESWLCEFPDGVSVSVTSLTWSRGRISPFAGVHRPEACMVAAGAALITGPTPEAWNDREVWSAFTFRYRQKTLHVFRLLMDERSGGPLAPTLTVTDRLRYALRLERITRRSLIQCTVVGASSMDTARDSARKAFHRTPLKQPNHS